MTLRARLAPWAPPLVYMGCIFLLSSFAIDVPQARFPYRDKVVHVFEYGALGLLFARACFATWPTRAPARLVAVAVLLTTTFGVGDEVHQSFVPGRSADLVDALADLVGACLGAFGFALFDARRRK